MLYPNVLRATIHWMKNGAIRHSSHGCCAQERIVWRVQGSARIRSLRGAAEGATHGGWNNKRRRFVCFSGYPSDGPPLMVGVHCLFERRVAALSFGFIKRGSFCSTRNRMPDSRFHFLTVAETDQEPAHPHRHPAPFRLSKTRGKTRLTSELRHLVRL